MEEENTGQQTAPLDDIMAPVYEQAASEITAGPVESSPFAEEGSAFADLELTPTENRVATPMRTMTAALAMIPKDAISGDPLQTAKLLEDNLNLAKNILENGQEFNLRLQTAADQALEDARQVQHLPKVTPIVTPEEVQAYTQYSQSVMQQDVQERAKTALEDQAVQNLYDLYATNGDSTEFRMALNRLDPTKGSPEAVIREDAVKALVIQNAVEKAELANDNESFIHKFFSGVLSIPQALALGTMFSRLNVAEEENGYEKKWWRYFLPGTDWGNQIEAMQSMTSAQLSDALPKLLENVKNASETLWIMEDPGRQVQILSELRDGVTKSDEYAMNGWNWLDIAAIAPITKIGKLLKPTDMIVGLGFRTKAAERIAAGIDTVTKDGSEAAARKFAITTDEIVENSLPKVINPLHVPDLPRPSPKAKALSTTARGVVAKAENLIPKVEISLAGDVSRTMRKAQIITDALKPLQASTRWFDEAEQINAVNAAVREAERMTGVGIADVEKATIPLANGSSIDRALITFDKAFASEQEARGFLSSSGYANSEENVLFKGVTKTERVNSAPVEVPKSKLDVKHDIDGQPLTLKETGRRKDGTRDFQLTYGTGDNYVGADIAVDKTGAGTIDINGGGPGTAGAGAMKRVLEKVREEIPYLKSLNGRRAGERLKAGEVQTVQLGEIVQDTSGAYFARVSVDIPETGFYTSSLHAPASSYVARHLGSTSNSLDKRLFNMATEAGQRRNKVVKEVNQTLLAPYKKLNSRDRVVVSEILKKGASMEKWFSDDEFRSLFERAAGKAPSAEAEAAYHGFQVSNDVEWTMRNADLYTQKVIRGFRSVKFNALGREIDVDAIVDIQNIAAGDRRVLDASTGRHYNTPQEPLSASRLKELEGEGYVMLKTEMAIELPDGTKIDRYLVKKSDLEMSPLRENQLAYTPGGHRLYTNKYFVKQTVKGVQPDTGGEFLDSPNTYITAPTLKNAQDWAGVMERARLAVKENSYTAQQLDEEIFQGNRAFPSGADFIAGVESKRYSLDHPFESLFDRELPAAYTNTGGVSRFLDDGEESAIGYYRTNGRLYYSGKGEALRDYTGEFAPTVDPFEAQARALYNVANMSSFSDFKTAAMERWVKQYRDYTNIPKGEINSPAQEFVNAKVNQGLNPDLANQIETQRAAIQRILGFRTDFDRHIANANRKLSEWIVGDSDNALRQKVGQLPLWWQDKNPVNVLRGIASDMKLGMFNFGQFFVQTSTAFSAISLSPKLGMRGLGSAPALRTYLYAMRNGAGDNLLDEMTKRGMHKLAGFTDKAEFKEYIKNAANSGFFDFNGTHSLVNNYGPDSTHAMLDKVHSARESARFFFNEAEVWNRMVAYRIAYGEAVERFGKQPWSNAEFRRTIAGRAENYAFNMSDTSRAEWQKGLLSIPTQFWGYNARMIEAFLGKDFSNAQKMRLLLAQMAMGGTAGIPVVGGLTYWLNEEVGKAPSIDTVYGTAQRGIFDRAAFELFGADMQLGARWSTGSFATDIIENVMGYSQYGHQASVADMAGGATFTIFGQTLGTGIQLAQMWTAAESGAEAVDLSGDQWHQLFANISTYNNVTKAMIAHQYGIYQTSKGTITVSDMPKSSAAFIALGFAPGQLLDADAARAVAQERQETIDDTAKIINNYLAEGIAKPDKFEENAKKVNALMNLVPQSMRRDVQRKVHKSRDPSVYDYFVRKRADIEQKEQNLDNEVINSGESN